jgi:hypothetical protein
MSLPDELSAVRAKRLRERPPQSGPVPRAPHGVSIQVGPDLHRVVDEAVLALARSESLYQRDAELVRLVTAAEPDAGRGVAVGSPMIRPVALATMREELSRCAEWSKYDARTERQRECTPPETVCAAVLARGEYPGVRPLAGVTEAPVLRPDGSILDTPGYDAQTGLVYTPTCDVPTVPDAPTQADAMRALAELCEVFADFPFVDEPARYVPIAAVLTLLARPAICGAVPLVAVDASTRGAGKSLGAHVVATIATGRDAPIMTYPPDEPELEKTLAACALYGSRVVALDNIAGTLGAAPLDKVLTATDRVQMRILGKSEIREVAWRALVIATGNNLVLGADTARRTLVCRMEPDVERPEERTGFAHPDLLAHVRQHRGRLVAAALTILRGYVAAGRPDASSFTWGSFSQWAEIVPAAIVWAGGANVLSARAVSMGAPDADADALRVLLAELPRLVPGGATTKSIVSLLWPAGERPGERTPDQWDGLREAVETLAPPRRAGDAPTPRVLGQAMQRQLGRVVGGRRLRARAGHGGTKTWSVEVSR